ncbi:putative LRR receptor-like serine/threonine-protein kinase [Iris pallida]|uniref:LRR receptor-like serine/threonine-protein kinase n=1 Tax=Iris pallida TaxID=29817 RepID=A0AAX6HNR1_IRIPA|nr:putative LRR receptor-like serine/threonine-protein kinase [Iris pallida]
MELIFITTLFFLLPFTHSSCNDDLSVLASAFASVANFQSPDCSNLRSTLQELILPSRNLTGTVSWNLLSTIPSLRVVDLSGNRLHGSVPGGFWSSPSLLDVNLADNRLGGALRFGRSSSLKKLNLSGNRFTSAEGLSGLPGLRSLDVSRNELGLVPVGLGELGELSYLDVSCNSMEGDFYRDLGRVLPRLRFLNVSYNNFSGKAESMTTNKFGKSAFVNAGSSAFTSAAASAAADTSSSSSTSTHDQKKEHKNNSVRSGRRRVNRLLAVVVAASIAIGLITIVGFFVCAVKRRRRSERGWKEEERGVKAAEEVPAWVAGAKWTAPVVVFDKPLMELRFSDLAAATSGFGRESQLAEGGRSGAAYRAVLPGDMNVVVRVAEGATEAEECEAAAGFQEMAKLRHPNLLPLLGYCIAGREKLLLYEYMERGDLHRWLHELPTGHPGVEDWSADAWEPQHSTDDRRATPASSPPAGSSSATSEDWPTRHRIALGIARGLAFLHQGWAGPTSTGRAPVVHGHLVPSNVLLGDDLEPRIADIAIAYGAGGTPEGDVRSFGLLVMELVTGRGGGGGGGRRRRSRRSGST